MIFELKNKVRREVWGIGKEKFGQGLFPVIFFLVLSSTNGLADVTYDLSTSNSCGTFDHTLINDSLVLGFKTLEVASLQGIKDDRHCTVTANINVPYGKKFRPVEAIVDGEVYTSENGSARLYFDYSWNGKVHKKIIEYPPMTYQSSFLEMTDIDEHWWYSKCSDGSLVASMSGSFRLTAETGEYDEQESAISFQKSKHSYSAAWRWDFADCDPSVE